MVKKYIKRAGNLAKKTYSTTRSTATSTATTFKKEFKKHSVTAITAAFAFLIALVWKDVIVNFVNNLQTSLGLSGEGDTYLLISAIFVTVIAVLALMFVSKWAANPGQK